MLTEQQIREWKQRKLNFIEEQNEDISRVLDKADQMRNERKQVEQEIFIINKILGDVE